MTSCLYIEHRAYDSKFLLHFNEQLATVMLELFLLSNCETAKRMRHRGRDTADIQ